MSQREHGFTLLELVITLVLLGILTAFAAPSFSNMIESHRVKRTSEEIKWLLVVAKSEAVMRNKDVYVHQVNVSGALNTRWCVLATLSDTKPSDCDAASSSDPLYFFAEKHRSSLNIQSDLTTSIRFDPLYGKPNYSPAGMGAEVTFMTIDNNIKHSFNTAVGRFDQCTLSKPVGQYVNCDQGQDG